MRPEYDEALSPKVVLLTHNCRGAPAEGMLKVMFHRSSWLLRFLRIIPSCSRFNGDTTLQMVANSRLILHGVRTTPALNLIATQQYSNKTIMVIISPIQVSLTHLAEKTPEYIREYLPADKQLIGCYG